ncbi:MAG TPA: nitrate/nitrite transporter [Phototrophicaceae bacterium]|nr:nitrate/nitrite transporter [Phototrophicaceae bacterium]
MNLKEFSRSGNPKTLFSAFFYFDVSFMIWVMLGPLGNSIAEEFALTASQKGLMTGVPVLTGSLLRLVLGPLADRLGGRRVALIGLSITFIPLLFGYFASNSYEMILIIGLMLGIAGASFAVALPLASRWYPPEQQGLVMGIAGAGNSGTVLASLLAPRLVEYFGSWRPVFLVAMLPLAVAWIVVALLAKDAPGKPRVKTLAEYGAVLRQRDTLLFSLMYGVTFGGFVGLATFLPIFFHDQYGLDKVAAGNFAALCVFAGSFVRPIGGYLADRFGGINILLVLYALIGVLALVIGTLPVLTLETILLFLMMTLLGSGNGSVFQIVPQRFPKEIGVVTGIVGAVGGVGGFILPNLLGSLKDSTGSFGSGFIIYTLAAFGCVAIILAARTTWQMTWAGEGGRVRDAASPTSPVLPVIPSQEIVAD